MQERGNELKLWIEKKGLTSEVLALLLNVSRITVDRWLNGKTAPTGLYKIIYELLDCDKDPTIKNKKLCLLKDAKKFMDGKPFAEECMVMNTFSLNSFLVLEFLKELWDMEHECGKLIPHDSKFCPYCGKKIIINN